MIKIADTIKRPAAQHHLADKEALVNRTEAT
ncbi:MAG: hypothetical protein UT64_C0010G0026 [Candidatus Falkowbacteria bacterium GW2011_GWF2_39_8]|uniref:Uncharacterized protein n=1 Tax=Candidatus Falkowbacteria bacterium GW2011_GWF2_39_8 TaxID=1618642 RepID=A0A0G0T698_9BACT|nr:MAG: hypothetical protein UT64_C0010G0026 [Candidatus Falkowbacteria bacterium GW2011_GWF2_39_8]